jgi:hypothetical protein
MYHSHINPDSPAALTRLGRTWVTSVMLTRITSRADPDGHRPPAAGVCGVLPGRRCTAGPDLLGATRRAQCARSLGARPLAGPEVIRRAGSTGRYQAGTVCLIAGGAMTRRAGDSLAGGRTLHPATCVSCRRRTPACPRLGVPHSVLERCGSRTESVARAIRAGGAVRAREPVRGPGRRVGPASDVQSLPAGAGY